MLTNSFSPMAVPLAATSMLITQGLISKGKYFKLWICLAHWISCFYVLFFSSLDRGHMVMYIILKKLSLKTSTSEEDISPWIQSQMSSLRIWCPPAL